MRLLGQYAMVGWWAELPTLRLLRLLLDGFRSPGETLQGLFLVIRAVSPSEDVSLPAMLEIPDLEFRKPTDLQFQHGRAFVRRHPRTLEYGALDLTMLC